MNRTPTFALVLSTSVALLLSLSSCGKKNDLRAIDPAQGPATLAQPSTLATVTAPLIKEPEKFTTLDSKEQLSFTVNPDQLSTPISDTKHGIKFAAPRDYKRLPQSAVNTSALAGGLSMPSSSGIQVTPLYAFNNEFTQNACLVSRVTFPTKDGDFKTQIQKYERLLKEKFKPLPVSTVSFVKDNIKMVQFLVQEEEKGIMRIVFAGANKTMFQFDYTLQRKTAKADLKMIESSIGSIGLLQ